MKVRATTAITVVIAVGLALLPFREVFEGSAWAVRTMGGVVIAALAAALLERHRHLPVSAIAAASVAGALLWSVLVTTSSFRNDPVSTAPWGDLRSGVFEGWGALLDNDVPLRDPLSAEMFIGIVAWVVTAFAIHAAARRQTTVVAIGGAALVLWLGVAVTLPSGLTHAAVGAAVGGAVLLMVATLNDTSDKQLRFGRFASLLLAIAPAALLASIAGELLPSVRADPLDPRTNRATSIVELEVPDILAEFSSHLLADSLVLTVESKSGDPETEIRLRLQVYDVHDGERWLPTTEFAEVISFREPTNLPAGDLVTLDIAVGSLDGPWIPLPDRLVNATLTNFLWSESTQTALTHDRLTRYSVTGFEVDRTGLEELQSARDEVDSRYLEVPTNLPESIRQAAFQAASGTTGVLGAGEALAALTRDLGRNDNVAPGHSLGRLRDDLAAGKPTGAEQLVSLQALMARTLGHPARVVVGYVTRESTVAASDLHVWTELAFLGVGWVPFEPVPRQSEGPSEATADDIATTTTIAEDSVVAARALPRELEPDDDPGSTSFSQQREVTWRDLGVVIVLLSIAMIAVLPVVRYARRRARRSHHDAEIRVLGAWAELVDRMREAGAPITSTTTVDDVVFMARQMDPDLGDTAEAIGTIASVALHGPDRSTPLEAHSAWVSLAHAEQALSSIRGRRAGIGRFIDPRVLRYRAPLPPRSRNARSRDSSVNPR